MSEMKKLGNIKDLIEGELFTYFVDNSSIAVTKIGESVFAIENLCSHAKCSLDEGLIEEETVVCPCHGAVFDLHTGDPLNPPATKPIKTFQVSISGEELYIKL
ncbi:Rieske (2Fe-2S) protein [Neobacillus mesonae]|uniref:Rieske (2Fe-2S) protein n=1 Tax=Neobacillus mesonae TaxID=1193713 RepID=UPI0025733538|nr:Rieske (2Fe-2S) protein [Neobacillus mesonae]MED4205345.1 Rieske (2Fe-2S) protein [Neobacillus mesonae]